ncbi:MAG: 1-(5-phosphoribosyl)-5-[(5-phosphoribosylamino)methylideneamino]imidazole-4-carboxamide isomerase [Oscillospiraceae bacterium]|nr:1-(5-phosphoribosyl)-5-[(5-phosphoribosylamino)methylideneamino]imidazole-4-carboxamide isomerase [Oscillospiraceae bacterium]
MLIFPAIDLYEGKAVRLYKGDYEQMTVYSENPIELVEDFVEQGAKYLHLIDLEGAKTGQTPNLELIRDIRALSPLFTQVGGGIRSMDVVDAYLGAGVDRVILGTAAVTDPVFLEEAIKEFGDKIAVGADIKNGYIAISGWTESSGIDAFSFCRRMQDLGVKTLICTDISRDGAMQGTNRNLYRTLSRRHNMNIIASGGVSSIEDIRALREMELYGAVIGKAYYTGAIKIAEALEVAK